MNIRHSFFRLGRFDRGLKSQSRWPRLQLYILFWSWRLISHPRSRSLERRQKLLVFQLRVTWVPRLG